MVRGAWSVAEAARGEFTLSAAAQLGALSLREMIAALKQADLDLTNSMDDLSADLCE